MDRFVRNFIIMSIVYLGVASIIGLLMLGHPALMYMKFIHSHLNMLGWVSMMIFGVGYHILPRFTGRPLRYPKLGEVHFWLANISLIGMLSFYLLSSLFVDISIFKSLSTIFGLIQAVSIFLFFYNMLATMLARTE
jgi:cbb3-type cytochrome oxidase subunit 1